MAKYDARTTSRLLAVQALYQMDIAKTPLETIIKEFKIYRVDNPLDGEVLPEPDIAYFEIIVRGVSDNQMTIDRMIDKLLSKSWRLSRLDSTLRAVLRCGVQELLYSKTIATPIIVAQYSDIAHAFFEGAEGGMANALLDNVAATICTTT